MVSTPDLMARFLTCCYLMVFHILLQLTPCSATLAHPLFERFQFSLSLQTKARRTHRVYLFVFPLTFLLSLSWPRSDVRTANTGRNSIWCANRYTGGELDDVSRASNGLHKNRFRDRLQHFSPSSWFLAQ